MSYWRLYRKYSNGAEAVARKSEDSEEGMEMGFNQNQLNILPDHNSEIEEQDGLFETDASTCSTTDQITDSDTDTNNGTANSNGLCKSTFKEELAAWAVKNKCSRQSVNELLKLLHKHNLAENELPLDSRTLLKTPRSVETDVKCGGDYIYIGLESEIKRVLQIENLIILNNIIKLQVNVDGIPLWKSKNTQFWPILCSFNGCDPFTVALFCGNSKPTSVRDFLSDFLEEYSNLIENGITLGMKNYSIEIENFVCDAPARSFLKYIKQHNAYYSCERCIERGTWEGRVIFLSCQKYSLRNGDDFRNFMYEDHQIQLSPLAEYGFPCVSSFCLDYMHLIILGATKRFLQFLKRGPRKCKLSSSQLDQISANLQKIKQYVPSDFVRKPRDISEMEIWKGTELRMFLLYTGPIVLKPVLKSEVYDLFMCLSIATSILISEKFCVKYLNYANDLYNYFANKAPELLSETFNSYNIHNLKHIAEDVKHFNTPLDNMSAFKYENYLQKSKKMLKSTNNPLVKVYFYSI